MVVYYLGASFSRRLIIHCLEMLRSPVFCNQTFSSSASLGPCLGRGRRSWGSSIGVGVACTRLGIRGPCRYPAALVPKITSVLFVINFAGLTSKIRQFARAIVA